MDQNHLEMRIADWLAAQQDAMLALLAEIVNIDSGSYDKAGVDRAGAVLQQFLAAHDIPVEVLPQHQYGDCLRARIEPDTPADKHPILLMGHRDTVYPAGEAARRPFTLRDGQAYGPGVADMKAGL